MRSRTSEDLFDRCSSCWVRRADCVCACAPRVETSIQFILLRHPREKWKSTNTGRLAALAIGNCQIVDYEGARTRSILGGEQLPDDCLLFPGSKPAQLASPPARVVVIDATWSQARKMLYRLPALRSLPRLSLPVPLTPAIRLRRARFPEAMSTCEAIAQAIAWLEGRHRAQPLIDFHDLWARRVLASRGRGIP